jgi:signal peptidase I
MARIRSKPLKRTNRMPRFKRKSLAGISIFILSMAVLLTHLFVGQFMRVKSERLAPTIQLDDIVFVAYSPGEPGGIVVVGDGNLRVLRRLVGVSGDHIQVRAGGVFRNHERLHAQGTKSIWKYDPPETPVEKRKTRTQKERKAAQVGTVVPDGFVYVSCEVPRLCRNSSIDGLVRREQLGGRVVYHWPQRPGSMAPGLSRAPVEGKK